MAERVLRSLGLLCGAVAVVAAFLLLLAAINSKGDAETAPRPVVVEVATKTAQRPLAESNAEARPAPAAAEAAPATAAASPGPVFWIARLRPGARLPMYSEPGAAKVETLGPTTEFGSPVALSVVKQRGRWLGVASQDVPTGELGWIERDPAKLEMAWTRYSLHADLSRFQLELRYGGKRLRSYPVTVGAPGTETPPGRYGITDAVRFDESPSYGCCALALSGRQTHLEPGWVGGDRLAIHGTYGALGLAESHGCIRADDRTMRALFKRVPLGTPVFVSE